MTKIERREHIRYDIQQEIQYTDADTPGGIFTGIIKNISHSGMCLYVLNPVRLGQKVSISSKQQLYREGIIVWFHETGEKFGIYKVGLKFM